MIVTGPPGAGKTSTARLLAERTTPLSVHLESDWLLMTIDELVSAPFPDGYLRSLGASR